MGKETADKKYIVRFLKIIPFMWGIFYEFSAFLCGSILLLILCKEIFREKRMKLYMNRGNIAFAMFVLGYWLSVLWAIDRGAAFTGAMKFTVPGIFFLLLMQLKKEEREQYIQTIPQTGTWILALSVAAVLFESMKGYFWQAGRLGGLFQYSNTMALYFLVGLVIACFREQEQKKTWVEIFALVIGILLTGSRTVFFFMILFLLYICMKWKSLRSGILGMLGSIAVITVLYVGITNDFQNIGRYLSTSVNSSTFLGRILYNIDGFSIVKGHMGGVGYKGYDILQPLMQTGVYTTMFVHNDWLQIMLDAGVIPAIALVYAVLGNLFSKTLSARNKIVIVLIVLHMFVDFDLQYLAVYFVLLSMFELEKGEKIWNLQRIYRQLTGLLFTLGIMYTYMAVPYFCHYIGEYKMAEKLYGVDTQIKEDYMLQCDTIDEAEQMADEILERNPYSYAAYNIKAVAAMEENDYGAMIENKKKGLAITRYNILEYEDYIVMLKKAIDHSDGDEQEKYIQDLMMVEKRIEEVLDNTNPLAYRLRDKPELELPEEFREYIKFYQNEK